MEIFTESQFSACYIHYRRRVRGYILSRVSDREEAEDLTQDVFENIWRCREGVRKELRVAHRKMVKQLSEKRRQAYILYFYRGMSYASIADRLSVSERSVGSHLQRAFRAVRLGVDGIYRYKAG